LCRSDRVGYSVFLSVDEAMIEGRRRMAARIFEDLEGERFQLVLDHHLLLMAAMISTGERALSCAECQRIRKRGISKRNVLSGRAGGRAGDDF
jgi:hypothetical protein